MDVRTEERYEDDFNQGNLFIMKRSGERVPFDASESYRKGKCRSDSSN